VLHTPHPFPQGSFALGETFSVTVVKVQKIKPVRSHSPQRSLLLRYRPSGFSAKGAVFRLHQTTLVVQCKITTGYETGGNIMPQAFFPMISRMRYINRWGLMRNTDPENIQEHSHMVAVLAHALAVIQNRYFGGQVDEGQVAVAALYHDASEILTGDMPTPIKYDNPDIQGAYQQVEQVAQRKLLSMLPSELQPDYEAVLSPTDPQVEALVKAADKLSAYLKCLEELKAGNTEFKQAKQQTYAALKKNPLPCLGYFMKHFLADFELTLDELYNI